MPDVLIANSHLVGLWLQATFTGVYYVFFPQCMYILWQKRRDGLSWLFPGVCLLMFCIVTAVFFTELVRAYSAFSVSGATGQIGPNPSQFFANSSTPLSLVKNSLTVALAIISDIIIVYRTYVVWSCNLWIIAIPVGLLFTDTAFGIWSTWTLAHTPIGNSPILEEVAVRVKYFFIFTFAVNIVCSSLICFKIWRTSKGSAAWAVTDRATTRVFEVVIESAGLYCAHLFILIVTDIVGTNVFFIFLDFLPPVTALVFSLLIVRTRTGNTVYPATATAHSANIHFWPTSQGMQRSTQGSHGGVEINLERVVHTDVEDLPTHVAHSYVRDGSKSPDL